jgi:hypothetical protein
MRSLVLSPRTPRLQARLLQLVQRLEAVERSRDAEMQRDVAEMRRDTAEMQRCAAEMRSLKTRVETGEAARLCGSEAAEATPRSFLGASPMLPRSAAAVELTRALASLSSLAPVPPLPPPPPPAQHHLPLPLFPSSPYTFSSAATTLS